MEHGNNTTQGTSLNPVQQNGAFLFSSLLSNTVSEDQSLSGQPHSLHLARQILNNVGPHNAEECSQGNDDSHSSSIFRSDHSIADIQALAQHLLALARSTTNSGTPLPASNLDVRCSDSERWSRDLNHSVTANVADRLNDSTNAVNLSCGTMPNTEASALSKPWPSSSPSAIAALAHLALLGLPPSLASTQSMNNDGTNNRSTNCSKASTTMESDPQLNGRKVNKTSTDYSPACSSPPRSKAEVGSKVIIRQTADADEHFFKALRRLKVDVSPELQASDFRILPRGPTMHFNKDQVQSSTDDNKMAKCQTKRSAAELAVDEHFEKSLGVLSSFSTKSHTEKSELTSKDSRGPKYQDHIIQTNPSDIHPIGGKTCSSAALDHSGEKPKFLVRQFSQHEHCLSSSTSPPHHCSANESFVPVGIPQPPPYNRQRASYVPGHNDSRTVSQATPCEKATNIDSVMEPSTIRQLSPMNTISDSIKPIQKSNLPPNVCGQSTANNFKPKKNWLAQYDGTEVQTCGVVTPDSPQESNKISFELVVENPVSDVTPQKVDNKSVSHSTGAYFLEECQEASIKSELAMECQPSSTSDEATTVPSIQTDHVQVSHLSPLQPPASISSETKELKQVNSEANGANCNNQDEVHEECTNNPPVSMTSISSRRDSIPSPFPDDQSTGSDLQTINTKPVIELPTQSKTFSVGLSLVSCSLSNPSSPCPRVDGNSSVSAVTPVSGITSGFFSGSTYSLDSSFSQNLPAGSEARETETSADAKSLSPAVKERSLSESKSQAGADVLSKLDNTDTPGLLWSLRKRAASEASPWSTLKRSRSVLTSPVSYNENCPSCSPNSRELLNENVAESASSGTDRFAVFCEFTSRSVDGTKRPLTPDPPNLQTYKRLVHSRIVSEMDIKDDEHLLTIDSQLPRYCNRHHKAYEHKSNSEPSTLSNNPTVASIGRSLSDAAALPSLHLTNDKNVYIFR